MTEAVSQVKIGAALDGTFDTTIQTGKRKMGELGAAAREAGKGTGAIGDGMAGSAQKVEAATKNMVGSIQRQIAALEAGDKSSRQYQESLARMRGIDTAALKPYLDQLDAAKLKQGEAAKSAESLAGSMSAVKVAAVAIGASVGAVAMFSKSIIDAADGLNDLSQRVGISVQELGKYQLAAEQSGSSMEAIAKGAKSLGENMLKNGDAMRKAGIDATSADGAMQQLADMFADMPDGIEKTTLATKLFGKAGMDLIPMLNLGAEGMRDAAIASAGYAEQMAIMAPLADSLNDKMAEVALSSKTAGAIMVNEFLPSLNKIAQAFVESKDDANSFASLLGSVVNSTIQTAALLISDVVFVLKGMGREIGAIAAQTVALATLDLKGFSAIGTAVKEDAARARAELDKFQAGMVSSALATSAKVQTAYNSRQGFGDKSGARGSALLRSLGGDDNKASAAAKKAIDEQNKALAEQAKLLAELSGYTGDYEKSAQRLVDMRKKGLLTEEAYSRAIAELVNKQPVIAAGLKAEEEATKATAKARLDALKSLEKETEVTDKQLAKQIEHNATIGLSVSALGELEAANLNLLAVELERKASLQDGVMWDGAATDEYTKQAAALRGLASAKIAGAQKQAGADAAKDMKDAQKKAAEESGKYWGDALMRAFESGKGFFQSLWDTIKNTMKTQVLKVTVQGVMGTLGIGASGAAMAGGSGGGLDMLGNVSSLSNLYSAGSSIVTIGSQVAAGTMGIANALGTMAANATGTGISGLLATNGAFGTAAAGSAAAGAGTITAGLAAIGPVGWAAIGIAALAAGGVFDGGGGPKNESKWGDFGAHSNSNTSATGLSGTYALGVQDAWKALSKSLAISTDLAVSARLGIDTQGDSQTWFDASAKVNGQSIYDRASRMGGAENVGRSEEELKAAMTEETTRILFAALKASDLPNDYKNYLNGIADNSGAMMAAIAHISKLKTSIGSVNAGLSMLRNRLFDISMSGAEAASKLADAFGGLDNLAASSKAYYDTFYTEAERTARSTEDLAKALALIGVALPATKDAFREVVSGLDLTTEAGRNAYAVMLTLAPEFAATAEAIDKMAVSAAASIMKAVTGNGQLLPAMSALELSVGNFTGSTTAMSGELQFINSIMGDSTSAVIGFSNGAYVLGTSMSASQQSAAMLRDQIAALGTSADKARIDFGTLGEVLANVNTETFVATIAAVFENLATRISGVLGSINTERVAVREAALSIINPTVMGKAQIQRGIDSIGTTMPGNSGVVAANATLASADNVAKQAQSMLDGATNYKATVAETAVKADKDLTALRADYKTKSQGFASLMSAYGVWAYGSNGQQAYAYNDATNRVNDFANWSGGNQVGAKTNPAYFQYTDALNPANARLAESEAALARARNAAVVDLAPYQNAVNNATATQTAAAAAAKNAALDYASALQAFAIDAGKSVTKLTRLREETVKYYESQKALADLMMTSAAGLRATVASYRFSQMTDEQKYQSLAGEFSTAYAQSQGKSGEALAGYGDKINGLINPLMEALNATGRGGQVNNYLAQAESVAALIEASTPVNYQADSLGLLGSIDATLVALETSSMSAENIIAGAVNAGSDRTAAGLSAVIAALTGKSIPAFAAGGFHAGGIRLVGENGPELEVTGPSRIFNASQLRGMGGSGGTERLEALVERLTAEVKDLRSEARATAISTSKTAKILERVTPDGVSLQTAVAA